MSRDSVAKIAQAIKKLQDALANVKIAQAAKKLQDALANVAKITQAIKKLQDALTKNATEEASRADLAEASALIKAVLGSDDDENDVSPERNLEGSIFQSSDDPETR